MNVYILLFVSISFSIVYISISNNKKDITCALAVKPLSFVQKYIDNIVNSKEIKKLLFFFNNMLKRILLVSEAIINTKI